jgi:lipopolysaccharide transport system ATP-binding protein
MSHAHVAIRVEGLGKQYRLGRRERYLTLRDAVADAVRAPWRALRGRGETPSVWALRDVNFEVEHGSVLGVIGANGAGKSTLLRILARITEPTTGRAEVRGRVGSLLEVGTGFHPELTGRENVFLSGALLGMSRADVTRKFDEIVAFAGVDRFIDTPLKQFSSGMAVRLGFAVAAHLETEILIVDEALAVGDASFQRKCLGRMAGVAREGRTVLFVSHDLAAIASLTETAICLDAGTIVGAGATTDVIRDYLDRGVNRDDETGVARLRERTRPQEIAHSGTVRLDWVRTTSPEGVPASAFEEGEAINVTFGLTVEQPAGTLEFVLGVGSVEQSVVVFLVTSPRHQCVGPGRYTIGMRIDPNHLTAGSYSLGLKVIADGTRADTVHDALRFVMIDATAPQGVPGEYRKSSGLLRVDYAWDQTLREVAADGFSYTGRAPEDLAEEVGNLT